MERQCSREDSALALVLGPHSFCGLEWAVQAGPVRPTGASGMNLLWTLVAVVALLLDLDGQPFDFLV